jgi:tRNA(His) 5'-end guanylyltransferase
MKEYEKCSTSVLPTNIPIILRIDGRAFHTFTKQFKRPFDNDFSKMMNKVAGGLCSEIANARIAYVQSDEISILIYNRIDSDTWFGNNVQKMTSVSASLATMWAASWLHATTFSCKYATFDSRVFAIPEKDVVNYFIWRQRDWERNSLHMLCKTQYSQADLQGRNSAAMHEMLHKKGLNWDELETRWKRGRCVLKIETPDMPMKHKWGIDDNIPIFTKDRNYIESIMQKANSEEESNVR